MLTLAARDALAQATCTALPRPANGGLIDVAPPPSYTDACAEDLALCRRLTAGYPPGVTTLAYLVPTSDWESFRQGGLRGFRLYLIAQLADGMGPADLPRFKAYVRAQQGDIRDHTEPPPVIELRERTPLGIFAETDRSISFGMLLRIQPAGGPDSLRLALVATNSAVVVGQQMLSLYVYREYRASDDLQAAKQLTQEWIACVARAEAAASSGKHIDGGKPRAP